MKTVRILVVDDEEIVCNSCQRLLSEEGYTVETNQDPKQGLGSRFVEERGERLELALTRRGRQERAERGAVQLRMVVAEDPCELRVVGQDPTASVQRRRGLRDR